MLVVDFVEGGFEGVLLFALGHALPEVADGPGDYAVAVVQGEFGFLGEFLFVAGHGVGLAGTSLAVGEYSHRITVEGSL